MNLLLKSVLCSYCCQFQNWVKDFCYLNISKLLDWRIVLKWFIFEYFAQRCPVFVHHVPQCSWASTRWQHANRWGFMTPDYSESTCLGQKMVQKIVWGYFHSCTLVNRLPEGFRPSLAAGWCLCCSKAGRCLSSSEYDMAPQCLWWSNRLDVQSWMRGHSV